jgi:hypothetical protein
MAYCSLAWEYTSIKLILIFNIFFANQILMIMKRGKHICETLKGIRREIAEANEIDYSPTPCNHEGDCAGTCPACEREMRWLESQLRLRQSLGKAVTIAGLSLGAASLVSCNSCSMFQTSGKIADPDQAVLTDSTDEPEVEMGEVPDSTYCYIDTINAPE